VLVESATVGQWEGYASVALEENPPRRVLRFSRTGGTGFDPSQATVQLDLVDAVEPHRVRRALVRAGTPSEELIRLTDALVRLADAAQRWSAYTLELNPIVLTEAGVVPLDAKADLDDYSKALVPDPSYLDTEEKDPRERAARDYQATDHRGSLRYVQLIPESEGFAEDRVASHSVGGGESMVVLDALDSVALQPTNYCDTSGSPSSAKVAAAAALVAGQSHISGLLFSTCIANQPLSVTAEGLLEGWRSVGWVGPTVVRFAGNQADQARDMVREWAVQVGAPVRVVGEETDEWMAAQLLADLLVECGRAKGTDAL
jgi:succinyl-CoA synthetase beta subunit